jgi:hypothetical protein
MGTGGLSLGVKLLRLETDQSPPTSAEVRDTWVYASTHLYVFMEHRDNFTFTRV